MKNKEMKYILTGPHATNKYLVAKNLENLDERFSVAERFSTNPKYKELTTENYNYFPTLDINKAYKNNAILTLSSNDGYYNGITMDEFYSNNVCVIELDEFNKISESVLDTNQLLVVWIDSSDRKNNSHIQQDILETKGLIDRLDYIDYIYFLNDKTENITEIIQVYEGASEHDRKKIREDFL